MQILARYSDIGRSSKVEAQAHYHQEGITMWITWYMAKFARESRYQEIEVEYYDFNLEKTAPEIVRMDGTDLLAEINYLSGKII
mgnify:CR=1 FL=1